MAKSMGEWNIARLRERSLCVFKLSALAPSPNVGARRLNRDQALALRCRIMPACAADQTPGRGLWSGFDGASEVGEAFAVEGVPDPFAPPVAVHETGVSEDLEVV